MKLNKNHIAILALFIILILIVGCTKDSGMLELETPVLVPIDYDGIFYSKYCDLVPATVVFAEGKEILISQQKELTLLNKSEKIPTNTIAFTYADEGYYYVIVDSDGMLEIRLPDETTVQTGVCYEHLPTNSISIANTMSGIYLQINSDIYVLFNTEFRKIECAVEWIGITSVNGSVYGIGRTTTDHTVESIYCISANEIKPVAQLDLVSSPHRICGKNELVILTIEGIYVWDEAQLYRIAGLLDLGISHKEVVNITTSDDSIILLTTSGYYSILPTQSETEKLPSSIELQNERDDIKEEILPEAVDLELKMGYMENSYEDVSAAILAYNKTNKTGKIDATMYRSFEEFSLAFVSGDIPDLICMGEDLNSMRNLASKNAFYDLSGHIDSYFNDESYYQNILTAGAIGKSIYYICPFFQLQAFETPTSVVGDTKQFETLAELDEAFSEIEMSDYTGILKSDMLTNLLCDGIQLFIDYETNTCDFENETFYDILEFSNRFANTQEDLVLTRDYRSFAMVTLSSLEGLKLNYDRMETRSPYGSGITYMPMPMSQYTGLGIQGMYYIGVSATSDISTSINFINFLLSEEYQNTDHDGLPVNINACNMYFENEKEQTTYISEDFDELKSIMIDYIKAADHFSSVIVSPEINIITEDAAAYFAGDKSAEDVATIIQNRVQIYLSEQE